jgi:hypothetical protein
MSKRPQRPRLSVRAQGLECWCTSIRVIGKIPVQISDSEVWIPVRAECQAHAVYVRTQHLCKLQQHCGTFCLATNASGKRPQRPARQQGNTQNLCKHQQHRGDFRIATTASGKRPQRLHLSVQHQGLECWCISIGVLVRYLYQGISFRDLGSSPNRGQTHAVHMRIQHLCKHQQHLH